MQPFLHPTQQVYISYGSLSNDLLLQRYGFVEEGNPHDRCGVGREEERGKLYTQGGSSRGRCRGGERDSPCSLEAKCQCLRSLRQMWSLVNDVNV